MKQPTFHSVHTLVNNLAIKVKENLLLRQICTPTLLLCFINKIMKITAKLTQLLPLQTGMGKNGQWSKMHIIV